MASAGSVIQVHQANRFGPLPLQLWKATVTVPTATTGVTVTSPNKLSGTVVAAWIDPGTLTASATVKVYDATDAMTTPTYAVDYTVPNPAVESKAILNARCRVMGTLTCVVASATAADSFDLYVWVDPNADTSLAVTNAGTFAVQAAATGYAASVTLTRTADTNAYTANDVIGAATDATSALTFSNVGPSAGGEVIITSASIEVDVTAVPSGMGQFNLHLYSVTPPSALGDNAAFDIPAGDRASYLGFITLSAPADLGSTLYSEDNGINKQITLAGANVYGYLVTVGAFTPASATVKKIKLHTIRP